MTETGSIDLAGLDPITERLVALVLQIVAGDYGARGAVTERGDGIDAVVVALNMLAESFEYEHAARARAEALLADAVDAYDLAPDSLCSCEVGTLEIVKCNATMARVLGIPATAVLGRSLLELVEPTSRTVLSGALQTLAATGATGGVDVELVVPGDAKIIANVTGAVKRDATGAPIRLLLNLRDETANRRLAEQLIQAQRMDSLGRLAGGIAHDFNNLLLVITMTSDLLARRLGDRPREHAEVVLVRETAERAAVLTRDLLAFARQQSQATAPGATVVIDELLASAEAMLARLAGKAITLEVQRDAASAATVLGPGHLDQILVNLIVNARDAMPAGGRITLATRRRSLVDDDLRDFPDVVAGDYVELTVTDTGSGIPPEVRARIFDPFFTTKAVGHGTGLGLSIVYGIVRQAHGTVSVRSEPGAGTTFSILFPITGSATAAPADTARTSERQVTLLVIEDDDLVRAVTARVLRDAGYRVLEASSGPTAIAHMREAGGDIAMVVSDVAMPGMDGMQTLSALREVRGDLPCLFVTGYVQEEARLRELRDVAVLGKPFVPATLVARVQAMLARCESKN